MLLNGLHCCYAGTIRSCLVSRAAAASYCHAETLPKFPKSGLRRSLLLFLLRGVIVGFMHFYALESVFL